MLLNAASIEKFLDLMKLTYDLQIERVYKDSLGRKSVCVKVEVYGNKTKKGNQYEQIHCYQLKSGGKLVYDEGNVIKGVDNGDLVYFGDNDAIDNYFDTLARERAHEYLSTKIIE